MGTGPTDLRCQKCFEVKTVSLFGGVGVGDVNSGRKKEKSTKVAVLMVFGDCL